MSNKLQSNAFYLSYGWRHLVKAYKGKAGMVYLNRLRQKILVVAIDNNRIGFSTVRSAYCYRPSSVVCWSVIGLSTPSEPCKNSFASTTLVGPGKRLLHSADRFGRILYCVHSTLSLCFSLFMYKTFAMFLTINKWIDAWKWSVVACA